MSAANLAEAKRVADRQKQADALHADIFGTTDRRVSAALRDEFRDAGMFF